MKAARMKIIAAMAIFGTIGIFRRYIPLDSSLIALVRGMVGTVFLLAVVWLGKRRLRWEAIRRKLPLLVLSGAAMGFNWILLFEAYNHTTVATATLCYYMAPIIVILLAPILLHQHLTRKKILCVAIALIGMVLVSGVLEGGGVSGATGIALGLGAAALYASVMLMNQFMGDVPAMDKTILQLLSAAAAMLPYVLLTVDFASQPVDALSMAMLLVVGVVHTGVAYWLYFGAMGKVPAQTTALLSYLDPVIAILLSALVLGESMSVMTGVGAALVLGGTMGSERDA